MDWVDGQSGGMANCLPHTYKPPPHFVGGRGLNKGTSYPTVVTETLQQIFLLIPTGTHNIFTSRTPSPNPLAAFGLPHTRLVEVYPRSMACLYHAIHVSANSLEWGVLFPEVDGRLVCFPPEGHA